MAAALAEHDVTPAAASIALRNLEQIEREDVLGNVRRLGPRFADRLAACVLPLPVVADVRGAGLLWAVELTGRQNPIALAATLEDCGLRAHVERTIDRTVIVQLAPPLVYGEAARPRCAWSSDSSRFRGHFVPPAGRRPRNETHRIGAQRSPSGDEGPGNEMHPSLPTQPVA